MMSLSKNKYHDYLNVPIPILQYAVINGRYNEILLWLFLKFHTSGHFKLNRIMVSKLMWSLGIKTRSTLTKYFNWLLRKKWLTYNSKIKSYRISSMSRISKKLDAKCYVGALLYLHDFKKFEAFVYSAIAAYLIRRGKRKAKRAGSKFGTPSKSCSSSEPAFYPLANSYIAKILKVGISTISELKKKAHAAGYISLKKWFEPIDNVKVSERRLYRKYNEECGHLAVIHEGKLMLQKPNLIKSRTILRIVKNLKT